MGLAERAAERIREGSPGLAIQINSTTNISVDAAAKIKNLLDHNRDAAEIASAPAPAPAIEGEHVVPEGDEGLTRFDGISATFYDRLDITDDEQLRPRVAESFATIVDEAAKATAG